LRNCTVIDMVRVIDPVKNLRENLREFKRW